MGRSPEDKQVMVADLKETLSQSQLALVVDFQGLTVSEITDLRRRLRPSGTVCKVTKNTLMGMAIKDQSNWEPMTELLHGPSAFLLVKEDFGKAIKAYQEFQKVSKKTELRGGVMDGKLLKEADVKILGDLPSKEQLMAQIAGAINGVASKLAVGINEVPGSLARALQAWTDKQKDDGTATVAATTETAPEAATETAPEAATEAAPEAAAE